MRDSEEFRKLPDADAFFRRSGKSIIPLTVKEILEQQIARKLAGES